MTSKDIFTAPREKNESNHDIDSVEVFRSALDRLSAGEQRNLDLLAELFEKVTGTNLSLVNRPPQQ